jgi:hypothetical protein
MEIIDNLSPTVSGNITGYAECACLEDRTPESLHPRIWIVPAVATDNFCEAPCAGGVVLSCTLASSPNPHDSLNSEVLVFSGAAPMSALRVTCPGTAYSV